jgi:hypothetical protein
MQDAGALDNNHRQVSNSLFIGLSEHPENEVELVSRPSESPLGFVRGICHLAELREKWRCSHSNVDVMMR